MNPNHKNDVLRYYEAEMRYLREAGAEFARAFPDRAGKLGLGRNGVRDPHVERLLEGFAFLMGRLRCKLDDELPELTESVVGMLWPQYLQMVPSLSMLELKPAQGVLQCHQRLAAGLPVTLTAAHHTLAAAPHKVAKPDGAGIACHFRTTSPVDLYPLDLIEADATIRDDGRSVLRLRFEVQPQAQRSVLKIARLRLYLHADRPLALAMYAAFTATPLAVQIRLGEPSLDTPGTARPMTGVRVEAAGFAAEDCLWPKSNQAFGGYQLLLEYFAFAEKFMSVDVIGLDLQDIPATAAYFDLELVMAKPYPDDHVFSAQNLRLYCTPIVNLFPLEADPIKFDHAETEYRVHTGLSAQHTEVYSVDQVQGFDANTGERFAYAPFASFVSLSTEPNDLPPRRFQSHLRSGLSGRFDTWVEFGGHDYSSAEAVREETISLSVTASNAMLPATLLRHAVTARIQGGAANLVAVTVLLPPTQCHYPPSGDCFHWRVLSHLAPNYLSMLNVEILRSTLGLYNWSGAPLNRRRIEAIVAVKRRLVERLMRGSLRRGVEIEVSLADAGFSGEGDILLFGGILSRFFELYAELNVFTRLVVLVQPSGQRIEWPETKFSGAPL